MCFPPFNHLQNRMSRSGRLSLKYQQGISRLAQTVPSRSPPGLFGVAHVAVVFVSGPAAAINAVLQAAVVGALWGVAFAKNRTLLVVWPAHVLHDLVPGGLVRRRNHSR